MDCYLKNVSENYGNLRCTGDDILAVFQMIKYHKQQYPVNIPLSTEEIAGHFDVKGISISRDYSLHTEYSYGKRSFSNEKLTELNTILEANRKGVPQLWKSEEWAEEFAEFIIRITNAFRPPKIIEIHPPFDDYTDDIESFIQRYKPFEYKILSSFTDTEIFIENRCGSVYSGGKFLISKIESIAELCQYIEAEDLKLRIALDIPQLYTAHVVTPKKRKLVSELLQETAKFRKYIGGVHLWGKGLSASGRKVAHYGDFNTYFNNDSGLKAEFLSALDELFNDNTSRSLVLEVNSSNDDVMSILTDLKKAGFEYR